jgi:hypothetical protein
MGVLDFFKNIIENARGNGPIQEAMTARLLITILPLFVFFCSCDESPKKERAAITQSAKSAPAQKKTFKYKKSDILDTLFTSGAPAITPLPFWSKGWPNPGKKFRIEHKNFRLPFVKRIRYMNLDSSLRYVCTNGEPIDTSVLRLMKYNYRFPNTGKYQVFYTWVSNGYRGNDPLAMFIKNNCNMLYDDFGYLILYDPLTQNAIVLNVANSYYIDSLSERDFFIDKNYTIHLMDRGWTDGDEDSHGNPTTAYIGATRSKISILKDGELKVVNNK